MSLYNVLDKVMDSKNFTVGGGSASAIAGAMSAGLVSMVARLSLGKDYGLDDNRYEQIIEELDSLCQELAVGAEEDTQAFLGIKNAFALPKGSDEEKTVRKQAIEDAAVVAATVPMQNAQKAKRIFDICNEMAGRSNPNAGSDITGGKLLARSAVLGCALNIDANLPLIKNPERKLPLKQVSEELQHSVA